MVSLLIYLGQTLTVMDNYCPAGFIDLRNTRKILPRLSQILGM